MTGQVYDDERAGRSDPGAEPDPLQPLRCGEQPVGVDRPEPGEVQHDEDHESPDRDRAQQPAAWPRPAARGRPDQPSGDQAQRHVKADGTITEVSDGATIEWI